MSKNTNENSNIYRIESKKKNEEEFENESNPTKPTPVELKPLKLFQSYELNDEGLRLYGKYKKQQLYDNIKWSLLGITMGVIFSFLIDLKSKKMSYRNKDIFKTVVLFGSIGFFSFYGKQVTSYEFSIRQREICQLYGKEIDDESSEEKL